MKLKKELTQEELELYEGDGFTTSTRFMQLIEKENYYYTHETYPYENRFIRWSNDMLNKPFWRRSRTHNIDIDEKARTIRYEGSSSRWIHVMGDDQDFDHLYSIIKSRCIVENR